MQGHARRSRRLLFWPREDCAARVCRDISSFLVGPRVICPPTVSRQYFAHEVRAAHTVTSLPVRAIAPPTGAMHWAIDYWYARERIRP